MHKTTYLVLFVLQFGNLCGLSKFIKPCVNNSNLSRCSRRALEALRPHLVTGIPEYNLPPIDPLYVSNLKAIRTDSRIAYYNASFQNMLWFGGKYFQIVDMLINPDEFIFRLKLGFPYLHLKSEAFVEGKVLNFIVNETGVFRMNYTNVVLDIVLNGESYIYEGREFIKWKKEDIGISFDESYLTHLSGFFKDPTYTEFLRLSFNKAARILVVSYRTVVEVGVGDFIVELINRLHARVPKDILYPAD